MSPRLIKVGRTYKNRGQGRTTRKVLEISNKLKAPWYSPGARPDDLIVRFEQSGQEFTLYLKSFAAWAGSVAKGRIKPFEA
jgi:hypothetical protein